MNGSVTMRYASDSCDHEPAPILSVEQARRYLIERALPVAGREVVATERALGRVLAEDQHSPMDVPGADNSAMDGYAPASRDLDRAGELRLVVSQRIAAGQVRQPLAFGRIGATPFLGLPGNPVSAFVTFCLFVRPFILCSQGVVCGQGSADTVPRSFPVVAGFECGRVAKKRCEYLRARCHFATGNRHLTGLPS